MKSMVGFFIKASHLLSAYLSAEFRSYNRERILVSFRSFQASWASFSKEPTGRIPVSNSSGGLLKPLIEPFIDDSLGVRSILLVSEPPRAGEELEKYLLQRHENNPKVVGLRIPTIKVFERVLNVEWHSAEPNYDLCSSELITKIKSDSELYGELRADLIILQSVLEHVGDPVRVLDNLLELRQGTESILALQTCNPIMRIHRHPIDTLRFHEDFFLDYAKRRKLDVFVSYSGASIFAFISTSIADAIKMRLAKTFDAT